MSERMTYDWALYEVASNVEMWERLCDVRFSNEEKQCLQEYLQIYKEHLDLNEQVRCLKEKLPPHPQINEVTKEYKELKQEADLLDAEIRLLVETTPLQNVLNYRFNRSPSSEKKDERQSWNENIQINSQTIQKAIQKQEETRKKEARQNRMSSVKEKLTTTFGVFGSIIYFVIRTIVYVLPFVMIGGNFFLSLVLIGINTFVPFTSVVFWIWGLICAIKGVQDVWAILYYIAFAVIWIPFYISTIISFFSKNN